ncbi:MAG: hypothetical protein KA419_03885 [Acidobacteria bacterium]|nr:hypothetical protein [Acidobacteriota bacterium]
MPRSLEPRLTELRDRLGDSPVRDLVGGVRLLRYRVAPGAARPVAEQYARLTGFTPAAAWEIPAAGLRCVELRSPADTLSLVVEESPGVGGDSIPRLTAIGFECAEPAAVARRVRDEGTAFEEGPDRLVTAEIPGLEARFEYLAPGAGIQGKASAWAPVGHVPEAPGDLPPAAVRANVVDHVAFRIRLEGFEDAATRLMRLTPYRFSECFTIGSENAETMTFRRGDARPALVASYGWAEDSVVWGFVARHGPRVHHTAFYTNDIAALVTFGREHGVPFTTPGLIGSEARGILQVFTHPLPGHGEIVEYIQRFHGFRGFFDPGNVGELMASTRPFN